MFMKYKIILIHFKMKYKVFKKFIKKNLMNAKLKYKRQKQIKHY